MLVTRLRLANFKFAVPEVKILSSLKTFVFFFIFDQTQPKVSQGSWIMAATSSNCDKDSQEHLQSANTHKC